MALIYFITDNFVDSKISIKTNTSSQKHTNLILALNNVDTTPISLVSITILFIEYQYHAKTNNIFRCIKQKVKSAQQFYLLLQRFWCYIHLTG